MTNPAQFISQVRAEAAKIVWPGRREVVTTTIMVFVMAGLLPLLLFLVVLLIRWGVPTVPSTVGCRRLLFSGVGEKSARTARGPAVHSQQLVTV